MDAISESRKAKKRGTMNNYMLIFIVIVVFIVLSLFKNEFFAVDNIWTFLRQASVYGILVLGVTWILAANEMDVSFPDIAAFSSMFAAFMIVNGGLSFELSILIALGVGSLFGLANGFLVAYLRFPSLIATIAMSGVAKALAEVVGSGTPIAIPANNGSFVYSIVWGDIGGVPIVLIVGIALFLLFAFIQEKTKFGQYVYALGDNREAAKIAGINHKKILVLVFTIAALLASFGGTMIMFMVQSGQPLLGSSLFLNSFTMIFMGALCFKIGKPNMMGTFIGSILIAMLNNGLTMLGTPSYIGSITTGILLIIGVIIVSMIQHRQRGMLDMA